MVASVQDLIAVANARVGNGAAPVLESFLGSLREGNIKGPQRDADLAYKLAQTNELQRAQAVRQQKMALEQKKFQEEQNMRRLKAQERKDVLDVYEKNKKKGFVEDVKITGDDYTRSLKDPRAVAGASKKTTAGDFKTQILQKFLGGEALSEQEKVVFDKDYGKDSYLLGALKLVGGNMNMIGSTPEELLSVAKPLAKLMRKASVTGGAINDKPSPDDGLSDFDRTELEDLLKQANDAITSGKTTPEEAYAELRRVYEGDEAQLASIDRAFNKGQQ